MKIDSFRELLIKKAHDKNLQTLIKHAKDDFLVMSLLESLEKMARWSTHRNANSAVQHFGAEVDPELHPKMIHDAVSHHASQYKAALNAKNDAVANKHARQLFKYMHFLHKLTDDGGVNHTDGALKVEAVDPKPWERSKYSTVNDKTGKFKTDTKGWSRDSTDYSFLKGAPHEAYKTEVSRHGHNEAYPLEQIKVNGKHLHIEDPQEFSGQYESHPFDNHPILQKPAGSRTSHYAMPSRAHTEDHHHAYLEGVDEFHNSPHMDTFFDKHEKLESENPEAYAARGSKPSDKVHAPIDNPLDFSSKPKDIAPAKSPVTEQKAAAPAQKPTKAAAVDIESLPPDIAKMLKDRGLI